MAALIAWSLAALAAVVVIAALWFVAGAPKRRKPTPGGDGA